MMDEEILEKNDRGTALVGEKTTKRNKKTSSRNGVISTRICLRQPKLRVNGNHGSWELPVRFLQRPRPKHKPRNYWATRKSRTGTSQGEKLCVHCLCSREKKLFTLFSAQCRAWCSCLNFTSAVAGTSDGDCAVVWKGPLALVNCWKPKRQRFT